MIGGRRLVLLEANDEALAPEVIAASGGAAGVRV